MSNNFKRIIAASTALVITSSLCGCSDSGYIATINGMQIPTGIYLYDVAFSAYNDAYTKISEDMGDDYTTEIKVFSETIEGKPASAWLKDTAVEEMKRYVAVETLFDEYGLALSAEDTDNINDYIGSLDDDLGYYAQYYGIEESTFGEHYENMGISKSSLRSLTENSYKENYVFLHNYDKDGLTPVSDDEINSYAAENYAAVKLLKIEFTDYQGISLQEDDEIQAVKNLAQSWADRYNDGEDWIQIEYEYDLRQAWYDAWVDAEDKYAEEKSGDDLISTTEVSELGAENEEGTISSESDEAASEDTSDEIVSVIAPEKPIVSTDDTEYNEYCQSAIDAVTVEKMESADEADQFISKESSSLSEKLTEYVWNTAADSKASLFEDSEGNCVYIVIRDDITTKTTWKEAQHESILHKLKDDAFEEMLKEVYSEYTVELEENLINGKYSPEKLKGIGE